MKELELIKRESAEIVDHVKQNKTTLVNRILPKQGHMCFEYNALTNQLTYARFMNSNIYLPEAMNGRVVPRRKVMIKDNCMYVTALNFKNAIKHLERILERKIKPLIIKS